MRKGFKNAALLLLILALGTSVVINGVLLKTLATAFEKIQYAREFPLGFVVEPHSGPVAHRPEETRNTKLLLVGDSRVLLWDTTGLARHYDVTNIGHGGVTSAQVLLQLHTRPIPKAEWVVIQVGVNDLHPIGALERFKHTILDNCRENIRSIVAYFTSRGEKVILTTIFPHSSVPLWRKPFWDPETDSLIHDVNSHITSLGTKPLVYVIDSRKLLANNGGRLARRFQNREFFLHVNRKAYSVLNAAIEGIIKAHP